MEKGMKFKQKEREDMCLIQKAVQYRILEQRGDTWKVTDPFRRVFQDAWLEIFDYYLNHLEDLQKPQGITNFFGSVTLLAIISYIKQGEKRELIDLANVVLPRVQEDAITYFKDAKTLWDELVKDEGII